MKKRTIFYFDGFNLYHGMLKDTPQRWLDLDAFARTLLPRPEEHEIVRINYFTARIKYNPARPKEAFNQAESDLPDSDERAPSGVDRVRSRQQGARFDIIRL